MDSQISVVPKNHKVIIIKRNAFWKDIALPISIGPCGYQIIIDGVLENANCD